MSAVPVPDFDATYAEDEAFLCNLALGKIGIEPILDTSEDSECARACRRQYARTRDELLRDYNFNFAMKLVSFFENTSYRKGTWDLVFDPPPNISVKRIIRIDNDDEAEFEYRDAHLFTGRHTDESYTFVATTISGDETLSAISEIDLLDIDDLITGKGIPDGTVIESIGASSAEMSAKATASATITVTSPRKLDVFVMCQVVDPSLFDDLFQEALALRVASKIAMPLTGKNDLVQLMQAEFAALVSQAGIASSKEKHKEEGETLWTQRRPYGNQASSS